MKKGTKLLSVLMAFVMILSAFAATMAASAQNVYKPTYTKDVTEEDVSLMLGDVNTVLAKGVLNGKTIESIYKMLPSMKALLMLDGSSAKASDKAEFYKLSDPERFADLPDGQITADVTDENGNIIEKGTFTVFFETHPIECKDLNAFQTEVNKLIDVIVVDNIMTTIPFAFLFGGDISQAQLLGDGLDAVCRALCVKQEKTANEVLGFLTYSGDKDGTKTYLKNIVAALLPDLSNNAVTLVQHLAAEENGVLLHSGVTKILTSLSGVVSALSSTLTSLGVDITAVQNTIEDIKTTFAALPVKGTEDAKCLDIEGVVSYLVASLTNDALTIRFVDRAEHNGTAPKRFFAAQPKALVSVKFRHMKPDRVIQAESTADVVKIIYDYLYDNLIADRTNNNLVTMALETGIIENAIGTELPKDVKDFILEALQTDREPLAEKLIVMLANEAGRELPQDPEQPTEPENPTKPENPTMPENPTKPETPATNQPTDKPADANNGSAVQNTVKIPKTGAAAMGFSTLSVLSAAAFVILAARSRRKADI